MEYKVFAYQESDDLPTPNPANPSDWHDSIESLEETLNRFGEDGWTFPGAQIEKHFSKFGDHANVTRYRLRAGDPDSAGMFAVKNP